MKTMLATFMTFAAPAPPVAHPGHDHSPAAMLTAPTMFGVAAGVIAAGVAAFAYHKLRTSR